jgi:hypothetical protein
MINSIDWTHAYDNSLPSRKPTRISVLGPDAMSNKSEYVAAERVARTQRLELIVWRARIDALMSGTVVSNHLVAPTRARKTGHPLAPVSIEGRDWFQDNLPQLHTFFSCKNENISQPPSFLLVPGELFRLHCATPHKRLDKKSMEFLPNNE